MATYSLMWGERQISVGSAAGISLGVGRWKEEHSPVWVTATKHPFRVLLPFPVNPMAQRGLLICPWRLQLVPNFGHSSRHMSLPLSQFCLKLQGQLLDLEFPQYWAAKVMLTHFLCETTPVRDPMAVGDG